MTSAGARDGAETSTITPIMASFPPANVMKDGILDGTQRGSSSPTESEDDDGDASSSDEQIKRAAIDDSRRFADTAYQAVLIFVALICLGVLIAVMGMMLVHILCGVLFMGVAAYTLVMGQEAESRRKALLWYTCTGAVLFLFSYWALQVVFRAPKVPTTVGCGGVRFVTHEGDGPGELRTEL